MKVLLSIAAAALLSSVAIAATQLAMGPDPGGHSGATVTPETTKTDNKAVDSARENRSGSQTEKVEPSNSKESAQQPAAKEKPTSDAPNQSGTKK
jgi:hypothetical protein